MEKFNKKIVWKFVIGIVALLLIIIGATYAYFTLSVQNLTDTTRVTGNVEDVGSVALKLENNIYMDLKAYDMQKWENDVTYYASTEGATTEENEEVIAYTQATGNHTYTCSYTLEVKDISTNSTYNAFQNMSTKSDGQIVLTVDGKDYDFNTNSLFPLTIDGIIDNVSSTSVGEIKAKYKMVNSSAIDQSALAGTDMKLEFKATKFECDTTRLLATVVKEETEEIFVKKPNYTNGVNLLESEYMDFDSNVSVTYSNSQWNVSNLSLSKSYTITFSVPEDGYYQFCEKDSGTRTSNIGVNLELYLDNSLISSGGVIVSGNSYGSWGPYNTCDSLGYVKEDEMIRFNIGPHSGSGTINVSFYLKKTNDVTTSVTTGYRYTGSNPNNYVEFNNELWRIIGHIPTTIGNGGVQSSANLVKIIREESLGNLVFDAKANYSQQKNWGSNTLYTLLNSYYYGAQDSTGTENCFSYKNETASTCDYTSNGIVSDSKYGKMIENVYWHINGISLSESVNDFYESEDNKKLQSYIGLMNASDYGYAFDEQYHMINRKRYSTKTNYNWLYNGLSDWTISARGSDSYRHILVTEEGNYEDEDCLKNEVAAGVRPTVYLDSRVYVTSGDGTRDNPYQISLD